MNRIQSLMTLGAMMFAASAWAQAPAGAPAGSMGMCKDGTYSTQATKKGACRGHQGVKEWYGASAANGSAAGAGATAPVAAPARPAPAPAASATAAPKKAAPAPAAEAAPGGGAGLVWVNGSSNVYHCQGDKWYGKTKSGSYMSEADAKAKGDHPDHGKACTH